MKEQSTMALLEKALHQNPNSSYWAKQLGLNRTALAQARLRGRLSPTVAGQLADALGESIEVWMLIAAFEAEPDRPELRVLRNKVSKSVNS